jgi:hypothetical protein
MHVVREGGVHAMGMGQNHSSSLALFFCKRVISFETKYAPPFNCSEIDVGGHFSLSPGYAQESPVGSTRWAHVTRGAAPVSSTGAMVKLSDT